MKKEQAIKLCGEKINELKAIIAALKTNETLSKATRGTQLYARGRERRVLHLISALCELVGAAGQEIKLSEEDMNTFVLITTLASERVQREQVVVNKGDTLVALLKKYENKKDVYNKITKAATSAGLTMSADGIFN